MSSFDEVRRLKSQEKQMKETASQEAIRRRLARLSAAQQESAAFFSKEGLQVTQNIRGETLTMDLEGQGHLDITAKDDGSYFIKRGGVKNTEVGLDIVRSGRTIAGKDLRRAIVDWADGDLR